MFTQNACDWGAAAAGASAVHEGSCILQCALLQCIAVQRAMPRGSQLPSPKRLTWGAGGRRDTCSPLKHVLGVSRSPTVSQPSVGAQSRMLCSHTRFSGFALIAFLVMHQASSWTTWRDAFPNGRAMQHPVMVIPSPPRVKTKKFPCSQHQLEPRCRLHVWAVHEHCLLLG